MTVPESARLALDLRFSDDFAPLFGPVTVGPLTAGNALCIQPMEGCDGTLDGQPGELTLRRYRRFGAGGAKLIWGEAAAVVEEGRANPRQLLVNENTVPGLAEMVTVSRLGLPPTLCRGLCSTNVIEATFSGTRSRVRRVTHWQSGTMALRWAAGALLETEKAYRKLMGYQMLPFLKGLLDEPLPEEAECKQVG